MKPVYRIFLLFVAMSLSPMLQAQQLNPRYQGYVRQFADEAVRQMKRYKIPASITLAQGLVETGAGSSYLATSANNHFGIKCHSSWQKDRVYRTDDAPNECFRKYAHAQESYEDHSLFLARQSRYAPLFRLAPEDYRGWARGLQRCGYATNRGYANMLIKTIEDYRLYAFDRGAAPPWFGSGRPTPEPMRRGSRVQAHQAYISYGLLYVVAKSGDSYAAIADEFDLSANKVAKYNDAPIDFPLNPGDVVYLQKKNTRAWQPYFDHVVQVGESMHSISQRYGIRLKNLYKMNDKDGEYIPAEGDVLRLR